MKLIHILIFVVIYTNSNCQKFDFGVGLTFNYGLLFSESNKQQLDGYTLTTQWSPSIGLNLFTEISSQSAFNFRFNLHAYTKRIDFTIVQPLQFDDTNTEFITYNFLSIDTRWSISYLLPNQKRWQIALLLGFSLGASKFSNFDYVQRVNYAPGQWLNRDINNTVKNKTVFISSAIIMGLKAKPPLLLFNRQLELNTTFHYSPLTFLEHPILLDPFEVEGKYHFVSVGINFFLNKAKKL